MLKNPLLTAIHTDGQIPSLLSLRNCELLLILTKYIRRNKKENVWIYNLTQTL